MAKTAAAKAAAEAAAAQDDENVPLTVDLMVFSNLGRTVEGNGFVYREMSCVNKRVRLIKSVEAYTHLQQVDLSRNSIGDMTPLKPLTFLQTLNLSSNMVESFKGLEPLEEGEEVWPHLIHLDLSMNSLTVAPPVPFKALRTLKLDDNNISTFEAFTGHEQLQELDLSMNSLTKLAGVASMPALKKLNLRHNQIEDLNGLTGLPALEWLSLAENHLQALEGPWQELKEAPLAFLDLAANKLETPQPLEVLRNLSKLRSLCVKGNPFEETAGTALMSEVLVCHWLLESVDGEDVTPEMLEEAKELNVRRVLEARERAKEEAAAAAAAAEAGEGGEEGA